MCSLLISLRLCSNFPIGKKQPLDKTHARWQLAIHLLDAVFYASLLPVTASKDEQIAFMRKVGVGAMLEGVDESRVAQEILPKLAAVLQRGRPLNHGALACAGIELQRCRGA